jgi:hypothetical protein
LFAARTNGGSSTRSSKPQSGAEVADVELIDSIDLGKDKGKRMEHDCDGRGGNLIGEIDTLP